MEYTGPVSGDCPSLEDNATNLTAQMYYWLFISLKLQKKFYALFLLFFMGCLQFPKQSSYSQNWKSFQTAEDFDGVLLSILFFVPVLSS